MQYRRDATWYKWSAVLFCFLMILFSLTRPWCYPLIFNTNSSLISMIRNQNMSMPANIFPKAMNLGGHRGMGQNVWKNGSIIPNYRENTILSFLKASEVRGVNFVEFDVQVTKDGVPVIWHDDDVIYGDIESPVYRKVAELTSEEFKDRVKFSPETGNWTTNLLRKFGDLDARKLMESLKPWVCKEDDGLPTFESLFTSISEDVGFDIEIKMATPNDLEVTPPEEISRMLVPILDVVDRVARQTSRKIFYSSFDPDICIALKKMQSSFNVLYLSGCGLYKHVDPRRTSTDAALEFASSNGMTGIVIPTSILKSNSSMVDVASERGLQVMTYGLENSDLSCVEWQDSLGVRAAIIDFVDQLRPASSTAPGS